MKKVGIFYGHFEYITAISYILPAIGQFSGILVYFNHFGVSNTETSGSPGLKEEIFGAKFKSRKKS
jgi:hypothetical protein